MPYTPDVLQSPVLECITPPHPGVHPSNENYEDDSVPFPRTPGGGRKLMSIQYM